MAGAVVPFVDAARGRAAPSASLARRPPQRRQGNQQRCADLIRYLRALDLDPVLVSSHDHREITLAFLTWADQRLFTRGRA